MYLTPKMEYTLIIVSVDVLICNAADFHFVPGD